MMSLFRSKVQCFYCNQTLSSSPANPRAFQCPYCECWNRYDKNGEIMSDEPAMHEESLNRASFAKRASPYKDRIPTSYSQGLFCRNCQTNQTLYINLLSNYLPNEDDPSYQELLDRLPAYKESLDARYPTICKGCAGGVEEQIQKAQRRARANAIGSWLHDGTRAHSLKTTETEVPEPKTWSFQVFMWRLRGLLWVMTTVLSVLFPVSACGPARERGSFPPTWTPLVPTIVLLSFLWSFWDPTWLRVNSARLEGRPIRVQGRKQWIMWQLCSWSVRLMSSVALTIRPLPSWWLSSHVAFELSLLYLSLRALHIIKPPSVVLTSSVPRSLTPYPTTIISANPTLESFPPPTSQPDDLLSSLSLSSQPNPTRRSSAPVFGETSRLRASRPMETASSTLRPSEPMDWTPARGGMQEEGWMRPQRFFAPSEPTGLEDLLSKTQIDDGNRRAETTSFKLAERVGWNERALVRPMIWEGVPMYLVALLVAVLLGSALFLRAGIWVMPMGLSSTFQNPSPPSETPTWALEGSA